MNVMKCFHFTTDDDDTDQDDAAIPVASRSSKVSWARSFSVASSTTTDTRRSEFDSESRDLTDELGFYELLAQRRTNDLRVFTFGEMKSATKGFNRGLLIGEGGFGCVYRGVVKAVPPATEEVENDEGRCLDVAIKQLNRNGFQGHKEWINEVNFLGVVNHPNLVKLVGYCAEDDERGIQRLLVYELMHNKSLEDHLLARTQSPLSWMARLRIAQDAARGLAYLHEEMDFQVYVSSSSSLSCWVEQQDKLIFRDFKASNILLDEEFHAKLSDFGLARQGPAAGLTHVSTAVVGTVGYAAPEYVLTGRLTAKSDVWSFGVVLYELITGRRAVERNLPKNEQKLLEWVRPYISDSKTFPNILDPRLEGQYPIKSAQKLASLANKCLMKHPKSRPKMSEVVEMLEKIISDASPPPEENEAEPVKEITEDTKVEEAIEEVEVRKQGSSSIRRVFDFKEMVSLRNRSIGRLDWRSWTAGTVRNG